MTETLPWYKSKNLRRLAEVFSRAQVRPSNDEELSQQDKSVHQLLQADDNAVIAYVLDNADAYDDGDLCAGFYRSDERSLEVFEKLFYCSAAMEWRAHFVAPSSQVSRIDHSEADYQQVVNFSVLLHEARIKPSQSIKAIAAFHRQYDIEAAKIRPSNHL